MDGSGYVMFSVIYLTQCTAIIAQGWNSSKGKGRRWHVECEFTIIQSVEKLFLRWRESRSGEYFHSKSSLYLIKSVITTMFVLMIAQAFLCRVCSCVEINLLIHLVQISRNWIEINRFLNEYLIRIATEQYQYANYEYGSSIKCCTCK